MNDFRKRVQVQRNKTENESPIVNVDKDINELNRMLKMYRSVIKLFEPMTEEWIICKNDMIDIVRKLAEMGVEVVKIDG